MSFDNNSNSLFANAVLSLMYRWSVIILRMRRYDTSAQRGIDSDINSNCFTEVSYRILLQLGHVSETRVKYRMTRMFTSRNYISTFGRNIIFYNL